MSHETPKARSRLTPAIVALSLLAIVTLGVFIFVSEFAVTSKPGIMLVEFRIRPSRFLLNRALSLPPGTTQAAVITALRGRNDWGEGPHPDGYQLAFYPDSSYTQQLGFTFRPPFVSFLRYVPLNSKAVVVHLDSSRHLATVEPEPRVYP